MLTGPWVTGAHIDLVSTGKIHYVNLSEGSPPKRRIRLILRPRAVGASGSLTEEPYLRAMIEMLLVDWDRQPPTRQGYLKAADQLAARRRRGPALWVRAPRMLTATIDDGWGHGLEVIQALARAAGVSVDTLGVMQKPEVIVEACRRKRPDLLGLTVLQFDSDDAVRQIVKRLPAQTTLVAGGAAYRYDPDFARRTGTPVVARSGAAFLAFLLHYQPTRKG